MSQETLDCKGRFVKIGTRVRVLAIPPFGTASLKKDQIARINSMLGEEFKVYDIDEYGHAWVEKWWETGADSKISHSLALGSNDMERVDA
jgi:hypothetical protein